MENDYAGFVGGGAQAIACPNCWGTQEWECNYEEKEESLKDKPKAFIQNFVDKYLSTVIRK